MNFTIEKYKNFQRFNEQYIEIYQFLLAVADNGYNEHFHWGRLEWMMKHTMLDLDKLNRISLFRDENDKIVGLVTYDTEFEDSTYLIHSSNDEDLLKLMVDFALVNYRNNGKTVIKVNSNDDILCDVLSKYQFIIKNKDSTVLQIDLTRDLNYQISKDYPISAEQIETHAKESNIYIIENDNIAIGSVELSNVDNKKKIAIISRFIFQEEMRNKGFGVHALKELCKMAFDRLDLKTLRLHVYCFNAGAIRCYEKVGFLIKDYNQQSNSKWDFYTMEFVNEQE